MITFGDALTPFGDALTPFGNALTPFGNALTSFYNSSITTKPIKVPYSYQAATLFNPKNPYFLSMFQ